VITRRGGLQVSDSVMGQGCKGQDHNPVRQPLPIAYPWPSPSTWGPSLRLYTPATSHTSRLHWRSIPRQPSVSENGREPASGQAPLRSTVQPQSSVPAGGPCLGKILRGFLGTGRLVQGLQQQRDEQAVRYIASQLWISKPRGLETQFHPRINNCFGVYH
jgi:hypothetical protein